MRGLNLRCEGRAEAKEACFCELGRDRGSWAECRMVGRGPSDVPKAMLAGQPPRENRASDRCVRGPLEGPWAAHTVRKNTPQRKYALVFPLKQTGNQSDEKGTEHMTYI